MKDGAAGKALSSGNIQGGDDSGFTLMETIAATAVVFIISGCVVFSFQCSLRLLLKAKITAETTTKILSIDRYICETAEKFHIPYWSPASKAAAVYKNMIVQSRFGRYTTGFDPIAAPPGVIRGMRVFYTVNGVNCRTDAVFPSVPVVGRIN
jgi:hypothetical protein